MNPFVLDIFYRAVIQAILLFGSEIWVILADMSKSLERLQVRFLQKVTWKT